MKLRIKGNSIRFRLGQSEVQRLSNDGTVEEFTTFGPSQQFRFAYEICVCPIAPNVTASFANQRITVRVPDDLVEQWATTDQVGISAVQRVGDHDELRILIEKDFECLEASGTEPQEDAFPHPCGAGMPAMSTQATARPA
jgi:hypothetical protein